jgi:hypothetical protein
MNQEQLPYQTRCIQNYLTLFQRDILLFGIEKIETVAGPAKFGSGKVGFSLHSN